MKELDVVQLNETSVLDGITVPAGTHGAIVHQFTDTAFLVEFSRPEGHCVVLLHEKDLTLVKSYEFCNNTSEIREG